MSTALDKRGLKRICTGCTTHFYDFNKRPVICPTCELQFTGETKVKSRRGRTSVVDKLENSRNLDDTSIDADDLDDDEDEEDSGVEEIMMDDDMATLDDDDDTNMDGLGDVDDDDLDDLDDDDIGDLDDLDDEGEDLDDLDDLDDEE